MFFSMLVLSMVEGVCALVIPGVMLSRTICLWSQVLGEEPDSDDPVQEEILDPSDLTWSRNTGAPPCSLAWWRKSAHCLNQLRVHHPPVFPSPPEGTKKMGLEVLLGWSSGRRGVP